MTTRKTLKQAAEDSGLPTTLMNAVICQIGGIDALEDVYHHGADTGHPGFTYYNDTWAFYYRHRQAIVALLEQQAEDLGEDLFTMLKSFRCLQDESTSDLGKTLYGIRRDGEPTVANGLAWFALEEVARALYDV